MPSEGGTSRAATHFDLQKHRAFIFALTITQIFLTIPRTTAEKESWGSVSVFALQKPKCKLFPWDSLGQLYLQPQFGSICNITAGKPRPQAARKPEGDSLALVCLFVFNKTTSCVGGHLENKHRASCAQCCMPVKSTHAKLEYAPYLPRHLLAVLGSPKWSSSQTSYCILLAACAEAALGQVQTDSGENVGTAATSARKQKWSRRNCKCKLQNVTKMKLQNSSNYFVQ